MQLIQVEFLRWNFEQVPLNPQADLWQYWDTWGGPEGLQLGWGLDHPVLLESGPIVGVLRWGWSGPPCRVPSTSKPQGKARGKWEQGSFPAQCLSGELIPCIRVLRFAPLSFHEINTGGRKHLIRNSRCCFLTCRIPCEDKPSKNGRGLLLWPLGLPAQLPSGFQLRVPWPLQHPEQQIWGHHPGRTTPAFPANL